MSIKLNGATNGSVELDVPDAIGSDLSVTIPATAGELTVKATDGSVDLGAIDIAASAPADSVNIDSSGRLLVGTSTDTTARLVVKGSAGSGDDGINVISGSTTVGSKAAIFFSPSTSGSFSTGSAIKTERLSPDGSNLQFYTCTALGNSPTERMKIQRDGAFNVYGVYSATGAASANVVVDSGGQLFRSTSSGKYKTDIEEIQDSYSDALLSCRPVWYRSICKKDNANYSWWGFIAEEVAAIDPRLVHWKTVEVTYDENGSAVETPCEPEPEGVAYDRFVPHLLNLIKRQKEQIEAQGTAIAALETRLTALEGGAS